MRLFRPPSYFYLGPTSDHDHTATLARASHRTSAVPVSRITRLYDGNQKHAHALRMKRFTVEHVGDPQPLSAVYQSYCH